VSAAAAPAWRLDSWDRFLIPPPFARVVVGYGAPIAVPRELQEDELALWQGRIETALRALSAELGRRAGEAA